MYKPIQTISSLTITISKLFRINVQHTVIKGYHYFKTTIATIGFVRGSRHNVYRYAY